MIIFDEDKDILIDINNISQGDEDYNKLLNGEIELRDN
jgi:hypothetical protein